MPKPDFRVTQLGSVVRIEAISAGAKREAESFGVEGWQGSQENFLTDWRPGLQLAELLDDDGFVVEVC